MNRKVYGTMRFAVALAILAVTTACIAGGWESSWPLSLQAGPQWVRLAAGVTVAGISLTLILLVATLLFGRFFCAVLCPLGTCQDVIGMPRSQRKTVVPNPHMLRYAIAALSLLFLAGGWAILFRYLDPFSRFAAIVGAVKEMASGSDGAPVSSGVLWSALGPLVLLVVLVVWKKRLYCIALCPVGTVLGLAAQFSLWRMRMKHTCGGCGRCDGVCPTGCIDSAAKSIDAERCVLCFKCTSVCPNGSIGYTLPGTAVSCTHTRGETAVDNSRRKFLAGSAMILAAAFVGRGLAHAVRGIASVAENVRNLILPPGAIDPERFARQCTGCQVCTANCPAGIIIPSPSGFGPVRLDYSHNGCEYHCTRCNAVCPSGALQPLDLVDKQWLKIGEAQIDLPQCRIVKDGIACGLCARACPKGAIIMVDGPDGFGVPEVAAFHCIGCGVCQAICPVTPKAISVDAIEQRPMGF